MSPEQRAKAICARITMLPDWRDRETLIAAAIREAENAKLEEIAALYDGSEAKAILSLKSIPKEPA